MLARIENVDGILYLRSGEDATQSAVDTREPHRLVMQNLQFAMGCLMFVPPPKDVLMLGVGGGSLVHFFRHYLPDTRLVGVERDASLLARMQTEFMLPVGGEMIEYEIADARDWIARSNRRFDLIVVDVYDERQMPDWVQGDEFWSRIADRLSERGCVTANLLFDSDAEFTRTYASIRQIFASKTLCTTVEGYDNALVYGFRSPLEANDMMSLMHRANQFSSDYDLPGNDMLAAIYDINPIDSGFI